VRIGLRSRAALALGLAISMSAPAATLAAGEIGTTTTITSIDGGDHSAAFYPTTFTVRVDPDGITGTAPCGPVKIFEIVATVPVLLTSIQTCTNGATIEYVHQAGFDLGTHTFKAAWEIESDAWLDSESATVELTILKTDSTVSVSAEQTVEAHHSLTFQAGVGSWSNAFALSGTVKFYRSGTATPICTVTARVDNLHSCSIAFGTTGTFDVTAVYSGNTWVNGSTSDPFAVTVTPDTVHASSVGLGFTTFYPATDGYRDVLPIRGTRNESISVTARVYSPGGSLLKTFTKTVGTGAYLFNWNGRNTAGTILPEGTYRVVQTLRDAAGTTKAFTSFVVLSKKHLVTITKTLSKKGNAAVAGGTYGTGTILENTSTGYILMKPGSSGWTGAGWQFTLPSATIYKSLKFRVYGKHGLSVPPTYIGMQNFSWCPLVAGLDWEEACFDHLRTFGNTANTLAYYTTTGSLTTNKSGLTVRGFVTNYVGPAYVYRAEVVVTYQVLQY
jgi:hypothetical protein